MALPLAAAEDVATYLEYELATSLQTVICKKYVNKFIEASIR